MSHEQIAAMLERIDRPSRELDGAIFVALHPTAYGWEYVNGERRKTTKGLFVCENNAVPLYTASLDAAMRPLPDGVRWKLGRVSESNRVPKFEQQYYASVGSPKFAEHNYAAIALCIAALRARITQT